MEIWNITVPVELLVAVLMLISGAGGGFLARRSQTSERNIGIRKQVYFEACDAMAVMQAAFVRIFSNPQEELSIDPKYAASLMRLHMVGRPELVKHIMLFQSAFGEAVLNIGPLKIEAQSLQQKSDHAREMHKMFLENNQAWIEKNGAQTSGEQRQFFQKIINENNQKMSNCMAFLDKNDPLIPIARIQLMKEGFEGLISMGEHANKCIIEMRKDIDLPFRKKDEKEYLDINEKFRKVGRDKVSKFNDFLEQKIKSDDFPSF